MSKWEIMLLKPIRLATALLLVSLSASTSVTGAQSPRHRLLVLDGDTILVDVRPSASRGSTHPNSGRGPRAGPRPRPGTMRDLISNDCLAIRVGSGGQPMFRGPTRRGNASLDWSTRKASTSPMIWSSTAMLRGRTVRGPGAAPMRNFTTCWKARRRRMVQVSGGPRHKCSTLARPTDGVRLAAVRPARCWRCAANPD